MRGDRALSDLVAHEDQGKHQGDDADALGPGSQEPHVIRVDPQGVGRMDLVDQIQELHLIGSIANHNRGGLYHDGKTLIVSWKTVT